ncbi:energy transducer TonB [Rubrolithibacter danxiaensis]|uniref:energy transducer TonB n=1 Tax=Rubrolithibacter danxiaensis TaxID=3390805 RepID=UPI003BF7CBE2
MISLKTNVYRNEWLDLVFANRNKSYGAYELRQNYSNRLIKALLISSMIFGGIICGVFLYNNSLKKEKIVEVSLTPDLPAVPISPKKPAVPPEQHQTKSQRVKTKKFIPIKVDRAELANEEVPTIEELQTEVIANVSSEGQSTTEIESIATSHGNGEITTKTEDNITKIYRSVEKMPEFPGGQKAFFNFLSRNLRYPEIAIENGIKGKVLISFVVERTGELTNIEILQGIGYRCNEEAIRVLKKAPFWIPGEQNGEKVRVQYTIPIFFNLAE